MNPVVHEFCQMVAINVVNHEEPEENKQKPSFYYDYHIHDNNNNNDRSIWILSTVYWQDPVTGAYATGSLLHSPGEVPYTVVNGPKLENLHLFMANPVFLVFLMAAGMFDEFRTIERVICLQG
jgi:hypothetical protein